MPKQKTGKKKRSAFLDEKKRGVAVGGRPVKGKSSKLNGGISGMKHIPRKTGV
jgi:predicted GTPase